jgi:hypothetical protein
MARKRTVVRIDGIKAGRTFTRAVEGKGNRRRVVYRVGENHSPEFYKKHPKGTIWTSNKASLGIRKAGARFSKVNKQRPVLKRFTTRQQKKIKQPPRPLQVKKRTNVTEYTTERKLSYTGQVGREYVVSGRTTRQGKKRKFELLITGFSPKTQVPIRSLTKAQLQELEQQAEKNARGQFLMDTGIIEAYDDQVVFTEPNSGLFYKYFLTDKQVNRLR